MAEKIQPIPARLRNVAVGGHVAGTSDIADDERQKDLNEVIDNLYQQVSNRYTKEESYSKEETNAIISRTPETDVVVLDLQGSVIDTLNNVPVSERPNKVFRVRNGNNTAYDEYGWTGTAWALLSHKDYGIDDEPVDSSPNLLRSGGLARIIKNISTNSGYVYLIKDAKNRIIIGVKDSGEFGTSLGVQSYDIPSNFIEMTVDKAGKIVSARRADGTLVEFKIEVEELELGEGATNSISSLFSNDYCVDSTGMEIITRKPDKATLSKGSKMIDILWTPKKRVPMTKKRDVGGQLQFFEPGVTVSGIPYSGTQEIDKVVGFDVSILTFMTAVNNPYSVLYTECIRYDEQQYSAYGKHYNGINSSGAYMGCVCSDFASLCAGLPMPFKTYSYEFLVGSILGIVTPHSINGLRTGDIIFIPGHAVSVAGIIRNDKGRVIGVVIQEQTTNYATKTRRVRYQDSDSATSYILPTLSVFDVTDFRLPLEDDYGNFGNFKKNFLDKAFVIYRNLYYEDNDDMLDWDIEHQGEFDYNNDICTFAGDRACFREGELVVLNYNLDPSAFYDWTAIELYRGDELVDTYRLADIPAEDYPEDIRGHALRLDGLTYGDYRACMIKVTNGEISRSGFTYFTVVNTDVSWRDVDGNPVCFFSSHNASPIAVRVVNSNGNIVGERMLTENDKASGCVDLTDIETRPNDRDYFIKVYFETGYGRVTNLPLLYENGDGGDDGGGDDD